MTFQGILGFRAIAEKLIRRACPGGADGRFDRTDNTCQPGRSTTRNLLFCRPVECLEQRNYFSNIAPTVSIVTPTDDSSRAGPVDYVVRASASDTDGSIARVDFWASGTKIGTTTSEPHSIIWTDVPTGSYKLTAVAFDNNGAVGRSSVVDVTVQPKVTGRTWFVSPIGNDRSPGSITSPKRSINYTLSLTVPGDTVVLMPGVYRTSIFIPRNYTPDRPLTLRAQVPGTVFIDGTETLTDFTKLAGTNPIYSTPWAYDFFQADGQRFISKHPGAAGYAEQFFVDGEPLTRTLDRNKLVAGTYFIDYSANKVLMWLKGNVDPRTKQVIGSSRDTLLAPARPGKLGAHVDVQGLTFRYAANFAGSKRSAIRTDNGWRLSNIVVEWVNGSGVGITGRDVQLDNVVARNNGQMGISAAQAYNTLIQNSSTLYNNWKKYNSAHEAGGGKWSNTDGVYMINYTAIGNIGNGVWFDINNSNFVITGGTMMNNYGDVKDSRGNGIMIEISQGPARVDNNYIKDNSGDGVRVAESRNVVVEFNTIIGGWRSVGLRDIPDREVSLYNVTVRNNTFRDWNWIAFGTSYDSTWGNRSNERKKISADFNFFDPISRESRLMIWNGERLDTLSLIRSKLGFDKNGTVKWN